MSGDASFRAATAADLLRIVMLLADDPLGQTREEIGDALPPEYVAAFEAIEQDPNNELIVAVLKDEVVGVMQLTFIPNLTHKGAWRAQIEGVRVASDARNQGIGGKMVRWAVERAEERGCRIVQLTTDKQRPDALQFYESLGFQATHEGMKLRLSGAN